MPSTSAKEKNIFLNKLVFSIRRHQRVFATVLIAVTTLLFYILYAVDLEASIEKRVFRASDAASSTSPENVFKNLPPGFSSDDFKPESSNSTAPGLVLLVHAYLQAIDPVSGKCTLLVLLKPSPDFFVGFNPGDEEKKYYVPVDGLDSGDDAAGLQKKFEKSVPILAYSFKILTSSYRRNFTAGYPVAGFFDVFDFELSETSIRNYPFDMHTGIFDASAVVTYNMTSKRAMNARVRMDVIFHVSIPGFKLLKPPELMASTSSVYTKFRFTLIRSYITIAFSMYVGFLGWTLSNLFAYLALQVLLLKRETNSGLMGIPIAFLFALPMLRNMQLHAPPYGSTLDIIGFYWNMALVALSSTAILFCFVIRWRKQKKSKGIGKISSPTKQFKETKSEPLSKN